jgi:hypothetical protein
MKVGAPFEELQENLRVSLQIFELFGLSKLGVGCVGVELKKLELCQTRPLSPYIVQSPRTVSELNPYSCKPLKSLLAFSHHS